jgi:transposase
VRLGRLLDIQLKYKTRGYMTAQMKICNRILSLKEIGVGVNVSSDAGSISIEMQYVHAANFKLKWIDDHYAGYFIDVKGNQSQAVVSIKTSFQAIKFVNMYSLLLELRAKRKVG